MKLTKFRVTNYRNIHDSGFIDVNDITAFVGQNEAGKSNLFEALYRINPFDENSDYNIDEDWPVDKWGDREEGAKVCEAHFELTSLEIELLKTALISNDTEEEEEETGNVAKPSLALKFPNKLTLIAHRWYGNSTEYSLDKWGENLYEENDLQQWAEEHTPKFVYIHDYEMSGSQVELDELQQRRNQKSWDELSADDQAMLVVADLAKINLDDFIEKGESAEGRTIRSFDKRSASAYLTKQFQELWSQKNVRFDIDIDATTLNIFVEDNNIGMPVRLNRRSTGFRWYVSFAWKFTHASNGQFKNCILLLEEPGIHLHYSAQTDLLKVFERLKGTNTILYTTHLASMVDLGYPERIRIVEYINNKSTVKAGVVSSQKNAMAVIEMSLGLTGNMSSLLGNRKTLIVEGGDDALVINKLAGLLRASGEESLSDSIYLWPAKGASKVPMYAAFAIGQKWHSGVLLDTDKAGKDAEKKIKELYLKGIAEQDSKHFKILMIGKAAGIKKTDAAIEELFSDEFYLEIANEAYRTSIQKEDLPEDGSDMITKRFEAVLKQRGVTSSLDKARVTSVLLKRFDTWKTIKDLPKGTLQKTKKLFSAINKTFEA